MSGIGHPGAGDAKRAAKGCCETLRAWGGVVRAVRESDTLKGIVRACLLGAAIWVAVLAGLWL
jgi:hypothetical protein